MIMKEIGGKIRLGCRITQWEWQAWKTEEGLWVNGADIIQDIIFTVYRHNIPPLLDEKFSEVKSIAQILWQA